MSMAWTSSEQVKRKSWKIHNKFSNSCEQVINMSWSSSEKNCEQVVVKYCSNEIFLKENQEDLENLWSSHELAMNIIN